MRPDNIFLSAVSAGCLLSFGCSVSLTTHGAVVPGECTRPDQAGGGGSVSPWPCDGRLDGRGPVYRDYYVHHGGCPSRSASCPEDAPPLSPLPLPGSLVVMAIITGCKLSKHIPPTLRVRLTTFDPKTGEGGGFNDSPYKEEVIAFVTKKQITPEMHQIFLRAIGCNWLVCLAVFLGIQAKDLGSKVVGMWWPVFALVSLGMAHVVANMFFVPLGIWMHTPGLSVGLYIWKENIIEGSLFCGVYYWYQYLLWDEPVAIDSAVYGEPMFESHHHLPHIHFPEFRRKSVSSDEETRIGSRRPSHC